VKRSAAALLAGAAVVGTLDLLFAIGFWLPKGVAPIRILQSIAAGVLSVPHRSPAADAPRSSAASCTTSSPSQSSSSTGSLRDESNCCAGGPFFGARCTGSAFIS
jgi:hypothetical protein